MSQEVPLTAARAHPAELVNQVAYGGETVVMTRHGRAVVAPVSAAEYDRFCEWVAAEEERPQPGASGSERSRVQVVETGSANPYGIAASAGPGPTTGP